MSKTTVKKGFIQDFGGNRLLPITRAELVLDQYGQQAFRSQDFLATQKLPGLMSKDDKEALDNLKTTISSNISKALESLNQSLSVAGRSLYLFNPDTFDAVSHKFITDDYITVTLKDNDVKWSLNSIHNDHIPPYIVGKALQNVKVSMPTRNDGEEDSAYTERAREYVAPIGYVDDKFDSVLGAINGLKFAGSLDNVSKDSLTLTEGYFYICKEKVTIQNSNIMETSNDYTIYPGDLIIAIKTTNNDIRFTHIPSGDEIKGLEIKHVEGDSAVTKGEFYQGVPKLIFGSVFNVSDADGSIIRIDLPHANDSNTGGYITKDDYNMFRNASSNAAITPRLEGGYVIAEFIGKNDNGEAETKYLCGKSAELTFDSENGTITYTKVESAENGPDITIKAGSSITLQQPSETTNEVLINVKLRPNEAAPDENSEGYTNYLHNNDQGLEPILGSFDAYNLKAYPGLATTQDVVKVITNFTTHWITIGNPLDISEDEAKNEYNNAIYWYGSEDLINALQCDILKNENEQ